MFLNRKRWKDKIKLIYEKERFIEYFIAVTLYIIAHQGSEKVVATMFFIFRPHQTRLTLKEIDNLIQFMKKNIQFEIPDDIPNNARLWPINQSIKFNRLINSELLTLSNKIRLFNDPFRKINRQKITT